MKTMISFIICSYNAPELISKCIDSILRQKYDYKKEILIVDGGSNKETLDVLSKYIKKFRNIKILHNKEKLPEGYGRGKWLGWKNAKGEFIAIVDQDNELQGKNWINEMLNPFKKEKIFGCACRLKLDKNDSLTNQYIALQGTDPFMAYRSLDGMINLKNIGENKGDYALIKIDRNNLMITGGNCFIYKKSILDNVGGYVQDTENIARLAEKNYNQIAAPKNAFTHHQAVKGFFDFVRKKKKWAKAYDKKEKKFSYMPKTKEARKNMITNLFFIFTILPNIYVSFRQILKTKEKAWILHPILTFLTGFIYFLNTFWQHA